MKVNDLVKSLNLQPITGEIGLDRDVNMVYCCDLLSWVMSHGNKDNIWITVQVHPNIIAVASLLEFSCIIIPENIEVEPITIDKAKEQGIPVLGSELAAAELCFKLRQLGI